MMPIAKVPKMEPAYYCLSCLHSVCPKGQPTWCTLKKAACVKRCAQYEAAKGRVK